MKLTREEKEKLRQQKIEEKRDLRNWNKNIARLRKMGALA